ncbi:MAG TPA: DUF1326 domain-containing protein [Thermoanaerobaculia bacterium]|jgi:hypothetical protein|nr:DUF1326 domain-containing protein [Thermoanaerobaculia bacterium]
MAKPAWSIEGPHFINCNCDYGCPCQFNALPTGGSCRAVVAWRIDEGYCGDVDLSGLLAVNLYQWPGPIHKGGGTMQSILDERASEAQRKALASVLQGEGAEPGTVMLAIYRAMCPTVQPPLAKPIRIEVDIEARRATLSVPGIVETTLEPIKNPVTGADHRARIDLPMGKEFHLAEVASGTTRGKSGSIELAFEKSHGHLVHNRLTSVGPQR